ncbi:hypothetical protein [Amycolatopsis jiangsuensis]|uniref:Uncharacterized protein n=1 Tax=Amycolatopsis jiangsuensis TaxID=1181879 RepID=A0A840IQ63_9PSEU|nr:hypothetical protein [Amycolatopsis jiangsuensis]MBB4683318.1 hypothetical protein [Amycolatopsis jiangsuensis]
MSQADLREHLSTYWDILGIEQADYITAITPEQLHRLSGQFAGTRTLDPTDIRTDERGRVLSQMWYLHAQRK